MHNVTIILISYAAAPQALKAVDIQVPVETLLSPQSFDLPTHKQTHLKAKVNTHLHSDTEKHKKDTNSHSHFADSQFSGA